MLSGQLGANAVGDRGLAKMQKRNSILRALSFSNGINKDSQTSKSKSRSLGDKATMAIYCENVLLPKQVTHSFYATWLHCYEELFDVSLTGKASHIKFELGSTLKRKDSSETLSLEKATLCGISLDCDLSGKYTQTEVIHFEDEAEQDGKDKDDVDPRAEDSSNESLNSSYKSGRLFAGRKKSYRFSYNGDM